MAKKSHKQKRKRKLRKEAHKVNGKRITCVSKEPKVSEKILLPLSGETAVIASKNKTAALCYDRIWGISTRFKVEPEEVVPEEIRCFGGTDPELDVVAWIDYISIFIRKLRRVTRHLSEKERQAEIKRYMRKPLPSDWSLDKFIPGNLRYMSWRQVVKMFREEFNQTGKRTPNDKYANLILREVAKSFAGEYGVPMATLFGSTLERDKEYGEGDRDVVVACLSNLDLADEDQLTWEHVLEFRKDKEVCNKYRRFLHWLDSEMVGKSQAFIEDEIAMKLEDYEQALKKHGIKTVLGTIQETLDGKYLLGAAGAAAPFTLAGYPVLAALAGAGLIVGKVVVKLIEMKLDFDDVERGPNSEVSWVYEAKKIGK